ncbi:DUF6152 family protein [Dyadobacter chenwenxiniae]|uniref:DUF6152 family protein n=1 Tax=Dyadobacter chenwenxiniae TaxID=2906456 RepID=A0A9X1PJF5_9BACT|nr:DUF6152 family protein [Dyadobacter chenwenxiniae]MCF0048623.1 DUF6152 family protein [Dyadobacter chenwenxiniae]MCF0062527.1 DUF6152 family protein [Dyadobacter chenwenxiniae]UON83728.1 DUF6152 family protein [Dyadobacter chenwenxiniae]
MKQTKNIYLALAVLLCASFTMMHHGWADYDQTKPQDFTTKIEESIYENPHVLAKVKYNKEMYTVFLAPTSRMTDRGLTGDMIKKGTEVRLVAYPHKTEKGEMRAERIFVDGKKFELR